MSKRVVITGLGALTATGHDVDTIWEAVKTGQSGIAPIHQWDVSEWDYALAAEIKDFDVRRQISDRKLLKAISRQDVVGLHAAQQAIRHSGMLEYRDSLADAVKFNDRTGVYVASPGTKFIHQHELFSLFNAAKGDVKAFGEKLFEHVHPMWLLRILSNNVLAYIGIQNGFKGPNHNIPNHGVSGAQAVAEAAHAIRANQMDRAVVVGYESAVEPQSQMYYASVGTLSKTGLRPFNADHDGTILAEASAALILESLESAQNRGAVIYGEVIADAFSNEASGIFSIRKDGEGLVQALQLALERAQLEAHEIGMITAHGNGNPVSDDSEASAISQVFAEAQVPVTGFKWSLGHSITAAGILETLLTLLALRENTVPGIATLSQTADSCKAIRVSQDAQVPQADTALCITRGFGSLNGCLVLKNYKA